MFREKKEEGKCTVDGCEETVDFLLNEGGVEDGWSFSMIGSCRRHLGDIAAHLAKRGICTVYRDTIDPREGDRVPIEPPEPGKPSRSDS